MAYFFFNLGKGIALVFPLSVAYKIACLIADLWCLAARNDRRMIMQNLRTATGIEDTRILRRLAREAFRNFGKYLVDFFRSSRIDDEFIRTHVTIKGAEHIEDARKDGKGAIILSAHLGNWELGGAILAHMGYTISGVVLTHKDERVNKFFTRQRMKGNMNPIEFGGTLRGCYKTLRANNLLALLGDRDFTTNGVSIQFCGKPASVPRGPAVFACRLGAPIVPAFMVRQSDDTFVLHIEKPIRYTGRAPSEEEAIKDLAQAYTHVIELYVKRYPSQWYVFKNIWSNNG